MAHASYVICRSCLQHQDYNLLPLGNAQGVGRTGVGAFHAVGKASIGMITGRPRNSAGKLESRDRPDLASHLTDAGWEVEYNS